MSWVTPFQPSAEELDACVECGLCLPHCPTYRLTGRDTASPRGRLMAMRAAAEGRLPVNEHFADIMGLCLQCRACEPVCPGLVPFGRAMEGARAEVAAQVPGRLRWYRRMLLGRVLASRRLMQLITLGMATVRALRLDRLLPRQLAAAFAAVRPLSFYRPLRGYDSKEGELGVAALLAGCVMEPWFGDVQRAAMELLARAGYRVVIPDGQTCCGALATHAGAAEDAVRLARRNIEAFDDADLVVSTAAGCSAHLASYGHLVEGGQSMAKRSLDVTLVVADLIRQGFLPTLSGTKGKVAVQDPCHLRHALGETAGSRVIVAAAGYEPIDVDPSGVCCGAAGMYSLEYPSISSALGQRKAQEVLGSGCYVVASANPGCEMQLRQYLSDHHLVRHPIELYLEAIRYAD